MCGGKKREACLTDYLTKLLRDRRAILEVAENKIPALRAAIDLEDLPNLSHTLVYTSDKGA